MKILFFSPFAGIWQHAFPEALVARALRDNNSLLYMACDGELGAGCMTMYAHGLTASSDSQARSKVCEICRSQRDLLTSTLGIQPEFIKDYLLDEDATLIEHYLSGIQMSEADQFCIEGHWLGRYALHEAIIHHKLTDLSEMTQDAFAEFRNNLKNVLIVFLAAKRFIAKHAPDRVVTYNTHVSTQYIVMKICEQQGIPTYGLHAGMNMAERLQSLYVFRQDMRVFYVRLIRDFENKYAHFPCDEKSLRNVAKHFLALCLGKNVFVYSAPKSEEPFDLRRHFSVRPGQKVLLATMSSYDEYYSSLVLGITDDVPLLFSTQVEWIKAVIEYVSIRPELFLIIRVHPREFPNKRDGRLSSHAKLLEKELTQLPANVAINWPTDKISMYDLAPETDVVLNGWSSVGKEMSLLGLPVVIYNSDILYYPGKTLNLLGTTTESYFAQIEHALTSGWSFQRIILTFRWLAWEYTYATIDIKDGYPYGGLSRSFSIFERIQWKVIRLITPQAKDGYPDGGLSRNFSIFERIQRRIIRLITPQPEELEDCRRLKSAPRERQAFVDAIVENRFVPELKWPPKQQLSIVQEESLIADLLDQIISQVYHHPDLANTPLLRHLKSAIAGIRVK